MVRTISWPRTLCFHFRVQRSVGYSLLKALLRKVHIPMQVCITAKQKSMLILSGIRLFYLVGANICGHFFLASST